MKTSPPSQYVCLLVCLSDVFERKIGETDNILSESAEIVNDQTIFFFS